MLVTPVPRAPQQCLNFFPLPHSHGAFLEVIELSASRYLAGEHCNTGQLISGPLSKREVRQEFSSAISHGGVLANLFNQL